MPKPPDRPIRQDPRIGFGQPCLTGTGLKVRIIFERFVSGDSVEELARDYNITRRQVQDAIRFEAATPARKRELLEVVTGF